MPPEATTPVAGRQTSRKEIVNEVYRGLVSVMSKRKRDFESGRLLHTFSIVARDVKTGMIGVAVQSHWFSVGSSVCWAEAGVEAFAGVGLDFERRRGSQSSETDPWRGQ